MDMAPRWSGGFGIQTRVERFVSQTTTWLEGVFTFRPSTRVTFKLPYVDDKLGDVIIGVPLKKYTNRGAFTSSWYVTPSVQFPIGEDSEWDIGVSFAYSASTPSTYQFYDFYAWEDRIGFDISVALHPFHSNDNNSGLFTMWDVSLLASDRWRSHPDRTGVDVLLEERHGSIRIQSARIRTRQQLARWLCWNWCWSGFLSGRRFSMY